MHTWLPQVVSANAEPGSSVSFAVLKEAVETHKPDVLFLVQVGRPVLLPLGLPLAVPPGCFEAS